MPKRIEKKMLARNHVCREDTKKILHTWILDSKCQQFLINIAVCIEMENFLSFLPNSTSTCIIIQHTQAMLPRDITCWLRYFADYTFQLDCATRFVKFIRRPQTSLIHNLHSWNWCCKRRKYKIKWDVFGERIKVFYYI